LNIFSSLITTRIVATLSALVVIGIGCGAGIWQLNRAEQKIRLGDSLASRLAMPILNANTENLTLEDATERRITARGRFLVDEAVWLENRPRPIPPPGSNIAQAGFYLMMPLSLDDQKRVLWVNRGWAPRNNEDRVQLPPISTPDSVVTVEGVAFSHPGRVYELGRQDESVSKPRIEQNFYLAKEATRHDWVQAPFILRESDSDKKDGLVRNWPSPTNGVDRHYAYAFQWFALAACGFLFWFISGLIQYRRQRKDFGD
jgi:surfeit locus 1 family protein